MGIAKPTSADDTRALRIMLHGLSESGKSMAALSASNKWPKDAFERTKKSKKINLDDTIYWDIDGDGHIGMMQHNIHCPYRIDVRDLCADYDTKIVGATEACIEETIDIVDSDTKKEWFVIIDALSTLDDLFYAYYAHPKRIPIGRGNKPDGYAPFKMKLAALNDMEFDLSMLGSNVSVIYTAHTRTLYEDSARTPEQKERVRQRKQEDVTVDKIPKISGQCNDLFLARVSFEFNFHRVSIKGKPDRRFMYAETYNGYRGKNRLPTIISGEQPPNLNEVLKKIRAGLA